MSQQVFPGSSDESCDSLRLVYMEKQNWTDTDRIDDDIVAIIVYLLDYKCITPN